MGGTGTALRRSAVEEQRVGLWYVCTHPHPRGTQSTEVPTIASTKTLHDRACSPPDRLGAGAPRLLPLRERRRGHAGGHRGAAPAPDARAHGVGKDLLHLPGGRSKRRTGHGTVRVCVRLWCHRFELLSVRTQPPSTTKHAVTYGPSTAHTQASTTARRTRHALSSGWSDRRPVRSAAATRAPRFSNRCACSR